MVRRISGAWLVRISLIMMVLILVGIGPSCDSPSQFITWDETTLSTLEGTPVVLNFWSTTCRWCVKQLPYLENVARQSEGAIKVVAINIGQSASTVQKFFGDYEPAMTIALDKNREAFKHYCLAYNNTGGYIPFTLFVDSEGTVKYAKIGAFNSEQELRDALHDVLGITIP